jgi:tetratricopeptide (TPR) repeat protein
MVSALLLAATLGAFAEDAPASASKPDLEVYRSAQSTAGRSADAHIRLALWCETHGLSAERVKHLSLAVLYDPKNTLARGLMGLVSYQGQWQRPEGVSKTVQDDAARKERVRQYLDHRAKTKNRAEDQIKLALWCEQNNLKDQATAHFHQALRLDPSKELAWKHLGFKKVGGRWVKPDLEAAARAQAKEQQKANTHWKPILDRLKNGLQSKDASRRAKAQEELSKITDRWAVPMIWATFGNGDVSQQQIAVQVLGQIDDPAASQALVLLAVFSGAPVIRGQAIATLRRRDAREFAGMLIGMIRQPIKYEVKKVQGPGKPGELLIKGQGSAPNVKRVYAPPAGPEVAMQPGDRIMQDENGLPVIARTEQTLTASFGMQQLLGMTPHVSLPTTQQKNNFMGMIAQSGLGAQGQKIGQALIQGYDNWLSSSNIYFPINNPLLYMAMRSTSFDGTGAANPGSMFNFTFASGTTIPVGQMALEAQRAAMSAQQQLQNDVHAIDQFNDSLGQFNDRVLPVLRDISGQDTGPDPIAWLKWFNNLVGFNQLQASERPTVTEEVPLEYQPQPIPLGSFSGPISVSRCSCFGAGTMVRTLSGSAPIEKLKVGDQVLTQSTKTGALAYKPILVVHHNPPSKTYRLNLGKEAIISSQFHRFWKPGTGWTMARDLKVGDQLRTLNGTAAVTSIEDGEVVPVYNLDVADDADFFVGEVGALAHDNSLPNLRQQPFDKPSTLDAVSPRDRTAK